MKKWLLIMLFLPLWAQGQNKPLKVELIDFSSDKVPSGCGYQKEWGLLKFKVKKSSNGLKKDDIILALFMCPRETMELGLGIDNFKNGKSYLLFLGKRAENDNMPSRATEMFTGSNTNDFPIYWMGDIKVKK